jgi:hydroxyacylglutathione hydrolase
MLDIVRLPVLMDNYVWLVHEPTQGVTGVVDPAVAEPVLEALRQRGWTLDWILNTHHHADHVGANLKLKRATGCAIVGPQVDHLRIPGIDEGVNQGDRFVLGAETADVHFVPGHTRGHIAFHFPESNALFCGDTIFLVGCGRLFEGTPAQMWDSLSRLRELPDATQIYCAHEYTASNIRFALTVDPDNAELRERADEVTHKRAMDLPTVPDVLERDKRTNPFLRADAPELAAAVGLPGASPTQVFAELRARKDRF